MHMTHWVALQRGAEMNNNPMFFDDKVRLEVNNYQKALYVLKWVENTSERDFENLLQGKDVNHKRKSPAAQEKMKRTAANQKRVRG